MDISAWLLRVLKAENAKRSRDRHETITVRGSGYVPDPPTEPIVPPEGGSAIAETKTVSMGHRDMNNETTLRTEKTERSNAGLYNAGTMQKQLIHEVYNATYNHRYIVDRYASGKARDLNEEPKAKPGTPVVIIGSGPSLDHSIKFLRQWRGGIVCSTSHALTLMYYGIEPTHIVALDPFSEWSEIEGVDWSKTRTKLVLHPGVWPELVEKWPGEMILYRQNNGRPDSFYATTQRDMYTRRTGGRNQAEFKILIRTEVTLFACSPPAQLFIADKLGYGTAVLCGIDFSYHSGLERFTSYTVRTPARYAQPGNAGSIELPAEWERHDHPLVVPEDRKAQYITTNNGQLTEAIHLFYKKNFMSAWRLSAKNVWSTDTGAVTEVPFMPIERAIIKQGKLPTKSREWIIRESERYLATVDAWVVSDTNGGYHFVESANPEVEIANFIKQLQTVYLCNSCGVVVKSEDGAEHAGDECPQCKAKGLTHRHEVSLEGNMKRIRKLMAWRAQR